ncbi:MAG: CDP-alcohol phosphatidyltransferase family protein [Candidatus Pseudobacter hemicellulosilyticus]|uniref:CDP-alcohol phosphatidyltransferase family protein n=1 Tax=Candidatus Pseudobacter hemicellulosilyticus TaxID=3121375 RepID=A0AAJ5WNP3_9BACT|nr:MAG: CDP-alcohol phosphatidyltransferase family protein [Pseudobacter sp.]
MKAQLPKLLIYSRFIIGCTIILLSGIRIDNYKAVAIILLTAGLLTDIFDGIIARKLGVSTQKMRRLDSTVDQFFFIAVAIATYIQCPSFFSGNAIKLSILLGTEALTYIVCFLKFRKEIATHSIGAKISTLLLFATLVEVILQCQSVLLFSICFWIGIITRIEIIAIILTLKKWTNDVPSIYHSIKLRQNKEIRRHKLFNG